MAEGRLAAFRPIPLAVLTHEVVQWPGDIGEIRNEGSVKVAEAEEASDILDAGGGRPLRDTVHFDWVHPDGTVADNHPKIFNFPFMEFAFGRF